MYLKCIIPTCKSVAEQCYPLENYINVTIPHNHPPPDEDNMKKQMFLNVLKKYLTDRTVNIRSLYEELLQQYALLIDKQTTSPI